MGCWNGTCGISQLPINAGQRIWAFLIGVAHYSDCRYASGFCYSTDLGFPMSLPIRGEYNDYGGIESIEESYNTEIILDTYLNDGEKFPDIGTFLNDYVERDSYVHHVTGDDRDYLEKFQVGLFMVLEDVALSLKGLRTSYERYCEDYPRKHMRQDARYFMKFLAEEAARLEEIYGKDMLKDDLKDHMLFNSRNDRCEKSGRYDNQFATVFNDRGFAGSPIFDSWKPYREYIKSLAAQGKTNGEEVDALVTDACDLDLVSRALSLMRKAWFPQSGKGGQGENYEFYWKLTTAMRRHIKQMLKEREDWGY